MKIAVAFFGITRHLPSVIDSINALMIDPLRSFGEVKIFSHLYSNQMVNNPRSAENGVRNVDECFLLNSDYLFLEKEGLCLNDRGYQQALLYPDLFNDNYISVKNLFHQLSSLKSVTNMMNNYNPDFIIFLRPDLLYHNDISNVFEKFSLERKYNILTPSWHRWGGGLNDRFAITDSIGSRVYGERINFVEDFIASHGAIHSESLLNYVVKKSRLMHSFFDLKASRVRLGGVIKDEDFTL
jgi:hypothetical protein